MNVRTILLATTLVSGLAGAATAQQSQGQMAMGGSSGGQMMASNLPEACRTAAQAGGQMMQGMQGQMPQNMQGMMSQMTETQKGLHEAMMKMDPAMMQGMMNKDADVAWVCAMIPHHLGAVEMARAGLKGAATSYAPLFPGVVGAFTAAFSLACAGVGSGQAWWPAALVVLVLAFVGAQRGQFRTRRPRARDLARV